VTPKSRSSFLSVVGLASLALVWPANASAQYHGHPGHFHGAVFVRAPYYYHPYYYPWYGYGFGIGFGFGYPYPYPYPYGYGWYPPYPYYGGYYDYTGSARLEVTPREAQVYVDGYFAGVVDDFDGMFQRLNLEPGEHDLALYLEGYRTVHQRVLFRRGTTLKITTAMQPLGPGETSEKPVPDPNRQSPYGRPGGNRMQMDQGGPPQGPPQGPPSRGYAPVPVNPADRDRDQNTTFGTLALRVQPADAEVLIDGERWDSPEGGSRLLVQLSEGSHRVEVRKQGFRPYSSTVTVRRGATETLNVSLGQGGGGVSANAALGR
jgi:PEGA domain-containing protein